MSIVGYAALVLLGAAGEEGGEPLVQLTQVWGAGAEGLNLPVQGAQPLREHGRADVGGGAQRVPAVCGGLFQITAGKMGDGEVGLDQ